jgi:hypothetical protein
MNKRKNSTGNRMQELRMAIKRKCFECSMSECGEVENCSVRDCCIYHVRPTVDYGTEDEMRATIRMYCKVCIGDSKGKVRGCPSRDCSLHDYRFGPRKSMVGAGEQGSNSNQNLNHDAGE